MPGLAFLCKKGWHTSTIKNAEQVWMKEQAREREAKKMEDLKRQMMEERQVEEMRKLQQSKGFRTQKHLERLDWMYEGPGAVEQQEKNDEYMLGKAYKPTSDVSASVELNRAAAGRSAAAAGGGGGARPSANELSARIHQDPMLQIRMQEEEAKQRILANPVRMRQLQEAAAARRSSKNEKKAKKQIKKQLKKAKKQLKKQLKKAKKAKKVKAGASTAVPAPTAVSAVPATASATVAAAAAASSSSAGLAANERRSRWGSGSRSSSGSSGSGSGSSSARGGERSERPRQPDERRRERARDPPRSYAESRRVERGVPFERSAKRPRLTSEERAARLAAMASDATTHNAEKKVHLEVLKSKAKAVELLESSEKQKQGGSDSFRRKVERDAFNGGNSMAGRLQSRRHTQQGLASDADGKGFLAR